jgi:hypothetical protein
MQSPAAFFNLRHLGRVRDGPQGVALAKRESSAGFVLANAGQPPRTGGSLLAHARPCANAGRLCESRLARLALYKIRRNSRRPERNDGLFFQRWARKTDNDGITR